MDHREFSFPYGPSFEKSIGLAFKRLVNDYSLTPTSEMGVVLIAVSPCLSHCSVVNSLGHKSTGALKVAGLVLSETWGNKAPKNINWHRARDGRGPGRSCWMLPREPRLDNLSMGAFLLGDTVISLAAWYFWKRKTGEPESGYWHPLRLEPRGQALLLGAQTDSRTQWSWRGIGLLVARVPSSSNRAFKTFPLFYFSKTLDKLLEKKKAKT